MRDLLLCAIILAALPFMLTRSWIGVLMWVWVSVMNPHRLTYGFAQEMPIAAIVGGATLISLFVSPDRKKLPLNGVTATLALFVAWMCVTAFFAINPEQSMDMFSRVMKIFLMVFVAMAVIHRPDQIRALVWVLVFSLGFYGVKGGIFTIFNRGDFLVWGPAGSFIEGNNEVALALIMTIPLMRFLQIDEPRRWLRHALTGAMLLSALAALGSHSRGAFLALIAMSSFFWFKSRRKGPIGFVIVFIGIAFIAFMPEAWMARMNTIETYQDDQSAMGRINAWQMAYNLARDRFFGGGFEIYDPDVFARYAPIPTDVHAAHSIYFQVLGEHGFVALVLFVVLWILTWQQAASARKMATHIANGAWVRDLAAMTQVSLIGYFVGGAFLSLAYFDLPYYLVVIAVATRAWVAAQPVIDAPKSRVRSYGTPADPVGVATS